MEIIKTFHCWDGDFSHYVKPGDAVDNEIAEHFLNCVPPITFEPGYFQCGEPYNHQTDERTGKCRATHATFIQEGEHWRYCGHCFIGEIVHREVKRP